MVFVITFQNYCIGKDYDSTIVASDKTNVAIVEKA